MGAAWRDLAGKKSGFERILKMVEGVRGMGMEGELRFGLEVVFSSKVRCLGEGD
jgi:hypothetical protein